MGKRIWWKDPEMITALSAVFIGVVALIIGAYQAKVSSDQKAASVWPYVEIGRYSIQGKDYGFRIHNKGVGPAIIKQLEVSVDNKPVETWVEAFHAVLGEKSDVSTIYSSTNKSVLAVQENKKMVYITDIDVMKKMQAAPDKIKISVCYCSIFEDCWLAGRGSKTQAVQACTNQITDIFKQ